LDFTALRDWTKSGRHENQWIAIMIWWSMIPDGGFETGSRFLPLFSGAVVWTGQPVAEEKRIDSGSRAPARGGRD